MSVVVLILLFRGVYQRFGAYISIDGVESNGLLAPRTLSVDFSMALMFSIHIGLVPGVNHNCNPAPRVTSNSMYTNHRLVTLLLV